MRDLSRHEQSGIILHSLLLSIDPQSELMFYTNIQQKLGTCQSLGELNSIIIHQKFFGRLNEKRNAKLMHCVYFGYSLSLAHTIFLGDAFEGVYAA